MTISPCCPCGTSLAAVVDNPQLRPRRSLPDGTRLPRLIVWITAAGGTGFGHAPAFYDLKAELLPEVMPRLRRQGRRAGDPPLHGAEVVLLGIRVQQHVDVQRRHPDEEIASVSLNGFEYLVDGEGGQDDGLAPLMKERGHHAGNAVYVAHRQHEDADSPFRRGNLLVEYSPAVVQAVMGVHGPLRPASGPGGVDDGGQIIIARIGYAGLFRIPIDELVVGVVAFGHGTAREDHVPQRRGARPGRPLSGAGSPCCLSGFRLHNPGR